ncbi:2-oxo-4-hydroxy-4-carboxy-5-ureidoimidazoline decarboxylase [Sanguibacter antarcticus]|uniref:2-oxo-4-hydroxy-4-carboxy-5-ureidoimidazoline decarboxylase n=1 Tax=Sanguibacter antarcticus TaxID=372484 RepID=A0A2A9E448_9MICO|nr:2-oxo-4-hydroxy-4-carboxy-5-ureidoimidazoline decarboxylase [Sanguibacter antarcticus]PFG32970.1 2-oxo-4-hydroxy-4-carboxy-5-ureidoimidazoline decarboxylase [Sanguibacter antarcticus]
MLLAEFNAADRDHGAVVLRPCLDIERWIDEILTGRPYASAEDLLGRARSAAEPLTDDEVDRALAHHPRIGERAPGSGAEAAMSQAEQGGVDRLDESVARALRDGNEAYERRFDRVFLIRAAGRGPEEIVAALRTRLDNPVEVEDRVVAEQLREIAVLRLSRTVTA